MEDAHIFFKPNMLLCANISSVYKFIMIALLRKIIYEFMHLCDQNIVNNLWMHVKHIQSQSKSIFAQ